MIHISENLVAISESIEKLTFREMMTIAEYISGEAEHAKENDEPFDPLACSAMLLHMAGEISRTVQEASQLADEEINT